uniref:Uncharacterized protein n=1 Tax=Ditylenchus dipsaci TaxID=166011 RepID=A0A915DWU3_9BILA
MRNQELDEFCIDCGQFLWAETAGIRVSQSTTFAGTSEETVRSAEQQRINISNKCAVNGSATPNQQSFESTDEQKTNSAALHLDTEAAKLEKLRR